MELRELKYFLAVAEEGSITRAAEALFVTQPNLSRQMKKIEGEIGRPLFVRGSRKITLTEAGRLLKKRAEEICELYDRTMDEVKAPAGGIEGEVRIGGGESRAMSLIARAATNMLKKHPKVKINIFSGDSGTVAERLDKGLTDFGVFIEPFDLSAYDSMPLPLSDRWGAIVRADSPLAQRDRLTPAELKGEKLILSRQSAGGNIIYDWFGCSGEELNIAARYNLLYNATLLVEDGMGCAVSLEGLINCKGTDLVFVPLEPELRSRIDIAWKRHSSFTPAAEAFFKELCDIMQQ